MPFWKDSRTTRTSSRARMSLPKGSAAANAVSKGIPRITSAAINFWSSNVSDEWYTTPSTVPNSVSVIFSRRKPGQRMSISAVLLEFRSGKSSNPSSGVTSSASRFVVLPESRSGRLSKPSSGSLFASGTSTAGLSILPTRIVRYGPSTASVPNRVNPSRCDWYFNMPNRSTKKEGGTGTSPM